MRYRSYQAGRVAEVTVVRNGRREVLRVCRQHLRELQRQQSKSAFERMFGASQFDELFEYLEDFGKFDSRLGYPIPRHREAIDIDQYLSEHSKELIQDAAQVALESGRNEIDTEHLLHALANSEMVKEMFKQFKIDPADVKDYIEQMHLPATCGLKRAKQLT